LYETNSLMNRCAFWSFFVLITWGNSYGLHGQNMPVQSKEISFTLVNDTQWVIRVQIAGSSDTIIPLGNSVKFTKKTGVKVSILPVGQKNIFEFKVSDQHAQKKLKLSSFCTDQFKKGD